MTPTLSHILKKKKKMLQFSYFETLSKKSEREKEKKFEQSKKTYRKGKKVDLNFFGSELSD